MMIFPWQTQQWQQLWRSQREQRLPHALLFAGAAGTGKAIFADSFARALLCQQVASRSDEEREMASYCNICHACRLIAGRVHPSVLFVEPEKEGQAIKVDQIRAVSDFINQSSLQGEYRIVVIHPAHDMNANAANALLKTLEEPSSGSIIILISSQFAHLPATILSRCQRILFPRPHTEKALDWLQSQLTDKTLDPKLLLQLAHGAPLAALRLVEDNMLALRENLFQILYLLSQKQADPIQAAAEWHAHASLQLLDFILSWVMDLLRLQLSVVTDVINKDYAKQLTELKNQTHLRHNTKWMEYLQQLRGQLSNGVNLNKQLMLESVFIRWVECGRK